MSKPLTNKDMRELIVYETLVISGLMREMKGKEIHPMLVVIRSLENSFERIVIQLPPLRDNMSKQDIMFQVGKAVGKEVSSIIGVIMVSEAWIKTISNAEAWRAKQTGYPRPSLCPDRQEIVSIIMRTNDGRGIVASSKIVGAEESRGSGEWDIGTPEEYQKSQDNLLSEFFKGIED